MTQRVLDVGNCVADHAAIRRLIEGHFAATVVQAHHASDALAILASSAIDLVLVNRKLDADYSDGLRVIEQIKQLPQFSQIPVMLVTNYEDHQQLAVQAGAEPGFGKLSLSAPETIQSLARFLSTK